MENFHGEWQPASVIPAENFKTMSYFNDLQIEMMNNQPEAKPFKVKCSFTFTGTFDVNAKNKDQAREFVEKHCGLVLGGNIHSVLGDDQIPDWNFNVHPERKIHSIKKN